jgi:predicted XRE-type DNA-binding protein
MNTRSIDHHISDGNVFADAGLPFADEHLLKAKLVFKINILMKQRKLRQVETAKLLGIRQPDVSRMLNGDFRQFSLERLMRFLVALGQDIEIIVRPASEERREAMLHIA